MHWSEIMVVILLLLVVGGVVASIIYKKVKKTPFTTCECGRSHGAELVKAYHEAKKSCCCQQHND